MTTEEKAKEVCELFDNQPDDYVTMITSLSASISNHIFYDEIDELKKVHAILSKRFERELITPNGMLLGRIDALITFMKYIIEKPLR